MRTRRGIILLVLGALALAATWLWMEGGEPDDREAVLARVGDSTITVARFNRSYLQYLLASGSNDTPIARRAHLDRLIQERLLAEEARKTGIGTGSEYEAHLERHRLMAAGARYFEREYAEMLPALSQADVRDAYEKSQQTLVLRQLFFRDPEMARAAYAQLDQGRDFVELANEVFNTAEYDTLAGFLGEATYWQMDDAVAEAVFDLPVGTPSPPVRSEHGWHIVRVEQRLRNPLLIEEDFLRRRESIEGRARIRRNRLQGDAWVRDLMRGLDVTVNEPGMRLLARAVAEVTGADPPDENAPPQPLLTVAE
ncbi:MAG: peptidylprolyl isomerase, partial [Rhodothermales bacterium]|nr:peptidylprolyl isomerase [Rhodothermales bacterium]